LFAELEASGRFLWDDQPDYPYAEFLRHQHEVQAAARVG
jgi:hypothetical protein